MAMTGSKGDWSDVYALPFLHSVWRVQTKKLSNWQCKKNHRPIIERWFFNVEVINQRYIFVILARKQTTFLRD